VKGKLQESPEAQAAREKGIQYWDRMWLLFARTMLVLIAVAHLMENRILLAVLPAILALLSLLVNAPRYFLGVAILIGLITLLVSC